MIMENLRGRSRGHRMDMTDRVVQKRLNLMKTFGLQQGLCYKQQRKKIRLSSGYLRDGNVRHYISVPVTRKTRSRNQYGRVVNLSRRDTRNKDREEFSSGEIYCSCI